MEAGSPSFLCLYCQHSNDTKLVENPFKQVLSKPIFKSNEFKMEQPNGSPE